MLVTLLALLAAGVGAWAQTPVTLSIDPDIPSGTPGHYYVNMPQTGSASLSIPGGITSFAIYDNGGKDGDYASNCDGAITLTAPLNCVLQISGNLSTELVDDYLYIWDGASAGTWNTRINDNSYSPKDGEPISIGTHISLGRDLTLQFLSDKSDNFAGIELFVTVISATTPFAITVENPLSGGSVAASSPSATVNTTVTLDITPASGYKLVDLCVVDENDEPLALDWNGSFDNTATFRMPPSAVCVTPVFSDDLTADGGLFINLSATGTISLYADAFTGVSSFKVYDDGGADGNCSSSCDETLILTAPAGWKFYLEGNVMNNKVYLTVYDGENTTDEKLLDKAKSGGTKVALTVNTASTGESLRINCTSAVGSHQAGLDLTLTLVNPSLTYALSQTAGITKGDISFTVGGTPASSAHPGEEVSVTASNVADGYVFNGITVTYGNGKSVGAEGSWYTGNTATFIMPLGAVTVTPVFEKGNYKVRFPKDTRTVNVPQDVSAVSLYDWDNNMTTLLKSKVNLNYAITSKITLSAPEGHVIKLNGEIDGSLKRSKDKSQSSGELVVAKLYDGNNLMQSLTIRDNSTHYSVYMPDDAMSTGNSISIELFIYNGLLPSPSLTATILDPSTLTQDFALGKADGMANGDISFTVGEDTNATTARPGDLVTVVPVAQEGYDLASLSYSDGDNSYIIEPNAGTGAYSFYMPSADVTVEALWVARASFTLTAHVGTLSGVTDYWATFYNGSHRLSLPEGATAYTMDSSKHLYRLGTDGRVVPAGMAVLVIANSASITLEPDYGTADIIDHSGGNILRGGPATVTAGKVDGKTPYVLGVVDGVVGFYKFTGTEIPANKAYYLSTP